MVLRSREFGGIVPIYTGNFNLPQIIFSSNSEGTETSLVYDGRGTFGLEYVLDGTFRVEEHSFGYGTQYCFPLQNVDGGYDYAITIDITHGTYTTIMSKIIDKNGNTVKSTTQTFESGTICLGMANVTTSVGDTGNIPFLFRVDNLSSPTEYLGITLYLSDNGFIKWIASYNGQIEKIKQYPNSSTEGGSEDDPGELDFSSDTIGMPDNPNINIGSISGFVNIYKVDASNISMLFGGFEDINDYKNYSDFIISCHAVPVNPEVGGNESIKIADKTMNVNGYTVYKDRVDIDCGYIYIKEQYKSFLDYENVAIKLFLPFIGFVDLKPEWVYDSILRVKYRYNIIDGNCIAFIFSTLGKNTGSGISQETGTCVATHTGNCIVEIPLSASNYARMTQAIASTVTQTLSGAVTGGLAGFKLGGIYGAAAGAVAGGVTSGITSGIQNGSSMSPTVVQSGSYSGSASFMGFRKPFLYFEWTKATMPEDYQKRVGYPCNVAYTLGELSGFTIVDKVDLSGINCTDEEKDLILSLLNNGIYL